MLARLLSLIAPALCVACGADAGRAAPLCRDCRAAMRVAAPGAAVQAWAGAGPWAPFAYDGPAGALVRALKFQGRVAVADVMAAQLAAHAPPELLRGALVPVPIHPAHRRRRGLDHARLLAHALAGRTGLDVVACLERRGDGRPQVGRGRRERMAGLAGSIVAKTGAMMPERALIVDDVVTTGSTIRACAAALHRAGCRHIAAVAYARTTAR